MYKVQRADFSKFHYLYGASSYCHEEYQKIGAQLYTCNCMFERTVQKRVFDPNCHFDNFECNFHFPKIPKVESEGPIQIACIGPKTP